MIEVALLFCFIAVLSAVVSAVRGIAMLAGMMWKQLRRKTALDQSQAIPTEPRP
jgi:hypothetical protein